MIHLEYEIEKALRVAIRTSINAKASEVPELATTRIIGFRLEAEDQTAAGNDATGLRVMISATPNTSEGYNSAYTLEPVRSMSVDIAYATQPDNDTARTIFTALEYAVRSVFEAVPPAFTMPTGVTFGAAMLTGGGSSELGQYGQIGSFVVEMKLSLT